MRNISDEAYEFKGTRFHIRAYVDDLNIHKPVFVIEEAKNNKISLLENRVELAKDLAGQQGRSPEEITWLELSPDRSLTQVDFKYTHTDVVYPDRSSLSPDEKDAVDHGDINSQRLTRYNSFEREASREEFMSQVGDALEPYEQRQNHAFARMDGLKGKESYRQERENELAHNPLYDYAPEL